MILCSSGSYTSYLLSLHSIHKHQREVILHSDNFKNIIAEFSFPLNYNRNENIDLVFVEDDEIMFNGKMYDIVHQHTSADSIFITCIPDKIEDEVRDQVNNQINRTDGAIAQKNFSAFKFNPGPFISDSETVDLSLIFNRRATNFFSGKIQPVTQYLHVPSPPPWVNV